LDFLRRSDDIASEAYLTKLIVFLALSQDIHKIFSKFGPDLIPWWMTACSRRQSSADVKSHHELMAQTSFATTTDLKMMWTSCHALSSQYMQSVGH